MDSESSTTKVMKIFFLLCVLGLTKAQDFTSTYFRPDSTYSANMGPTGFTSTSNMGPTSFNDYGPDLFTNFFSPNTSCGGDSQRLDPDFQYFFNTLFSGANMGGYNNQGGANSQGGPFYNYQGGMNNQGRPFTNQGRPFYNQGYQGNGNSGFTGNRFNYNGNTSSNNYNPYAGYGFGNFAFNPMNFGYQGNNGGRGQQQQFGRGNQGKGNYYGGNYGSNYDYYGFGNGINYNQGGYGGRQNGQNGNYKPNAPFYWYFA